MRWHVQQFMPARQHGVGVTSLHGVRGKALATTDGQHLGGTLRHDRLPNIHGVAKISRRLCASLYAHRVLQAPRLDGFHHKPISR